MATNTTQYNFQKPEVGADTDAWGDMLNGNWDSTDSLLRGATALSNIGIGATNTTIPLVCNAASASDITATFSGKVGIGTSSPAYTLDVTGSAQLSGGDLILRSDSDDADTQYIRFENYPSDIRTAYIRADYTSQTAGGGTALAFGANDHATATDTDSMVIDIEGNVGINTSSPQAPLHVHGDINLGNSAGADAADVEIASLNFYNRDTSNSAPNNAAIIRAYTSQATGSGGYLTLATSNGTEAEGADATEKMRIDAAGHAIIPAGITLGTTTGTYAAANTLDDYEEGTWTPTVYANDNTTVLTEGVHYNLRGASYTRIGQLVHLVIRLEDIRPTKDDFNFSIPFSSFDNDLVIGSTLGASIGGEANTSPIFGRAGTRFEIRKDDYQFAYGTCQYRTNS